MELSESQKIQIAKSFILASPPGEVKDVVKDLNALLGGEDTLRGQLPDIMREYNLKNNEVLKDSGGAKVLVCSGGEVDASSSSFVDADGGKILTVDHVKGEITGAQGDSPALGEAAEELRGSAQGEMSKYVKASLAEGCAAVHGKEESDGSVTITCSLSGRKLSPSNFWNGRWSASYKCVVPAGAASAKIDGHVRAEVHVYEEGNVQLESTKQVSTEVSFASPSGFGAAFASKIKEVESGYHRFLDESYGSVAETSFKALRRKMPLTQQKFQWSKIATYSLAKELTNK